ncbi:MAG: NADH-quinone oxidoreductase subunit M [Alphaproteobacteria bacterium]
MENMHWPLLSILTWLPLAGALLTLLVNNRDAAQEAANARAVALWVSVITLILSGLLLAGFRHDMYGMQFEEKHAWIPDLNINYHMGVDGLSVMFVALTALLTPLCILVSWTSITERVKHYMAAFLALESAVIGVFCALDFALFYIFWEAMLIPMFLIIGIWGGENRVYATLKFFIYTFAGSLLMLVAMLYLYNVSGGSFDIQKLAELDLPLNVQILLWLAFFAAFAVKVPMWPFHTWLPDAHVQAPTAGSVILAGILLKMGGYGFLRFNLPILPEATAYFAPAMFWLSAIAIVWAALVAFAQTDIKKMIAYSSVSHMGFVTLGIFAGTSDALNGAILQMVNHGVVSAALFMLIGVIYERMHTRNITHFGGVVQPMPVYAGIFMVFMLASVALPGTNSFVGEFLILSGAYPVAQAATIVACSGVVLGALYMLWLYRKMIFGEAKHTAVRELEDMNAREVAMFIPLILAVFYIGLMPDKTIDISRLAVEKLRSQSIALPQSAIGEYALPTLPAAPTEEMH